ncbi:hypothetical protein BCR44DRAFT_47365 [Catenaria anguillulae PL171]|uniref:Uncharacterized protein n=1 Tax=Catenaria anguillulae PL171 TaxID=765915 RepID=A0A1Y2HW52_9FUNG|nr:hypothetical protein BCR44DRAFT_47365 [Catenaria anguillulae PL171]
MSPAVIPARPRPPHPALQLFIVGGLSLLAYGGYAPAPLLHPWLDYLQSLFTQRLLWWLFVWSMTVHCAEAVWVAHYLITTSAAASSKLTPADVFVWTVGTVVFGMGVASQLIWPKKTQNKGGKRQ